MTDTAERTGTRWQRPFVAILGGREAAEGLWPLLWVTLASTLVTSAFYSYTGVWAVVALHASPAELGWMYAVNAIVGLGAGYVGGALSDRLGYRRVLVVCLAAQAILILCCAFVGHRTLLGLVLVVAASTAGTPAWAIRSAFVAVLLPPERRAQGFSSLRIFNNMASIVGPSTVALLLLAFSWPTIFSVLGLVGLGSAAVARLVLPANAVVDRDKELARAPRLAAFRDVPFLLLLSSALLSFVVYVAFASVLPIVAVSSYHFERSTWGFLVVINPVIVVLCQGALTRAVAAVRISWRFAAGTLLMALPWLALLGGHSVALVALLIVVFVMGEMLWSPATQAAAADFAPADAKGAYLGAYGSSVSVGYALGPLIFLRVLGAAGPGTMWMLVAAVGLLAAVLGIFAMHLRARMAVSQ